MIADNPQEELVRLEAAIGTLRESVDQMLTSSELDLTGESREVIEAYRLFAHDQGWRQRMRDAVRTGLTAEAGRRTRAGRVAPARHPPRRSGAARTRPRSRRSGAAAAAPLSGDNGKATAELPRDAVLVARAMGPAELLDYGRDKLLALVLEEAATDLACRHRRAFDGLYRWSAPSKASPMRRAPATAWRWTAKPAKRICARPRTSFRRSMPSAACAPPGVAAFRRGARSSRGHARRGSDPPDDERGPAARHAASGGIGRRRHRPVPHRTAVHDRRDHAAAEGPDGFLHSSVLDAAGDQPGRLPHPRSRRRQGAALCPWEREKIRRSAGGRSASRSTARRLLRYQARALLAAASWKSAAHPLADGQRCLGIQPARAR